MAKKDTLSFHPGIPPDLEHAPLVREEAIDWLETRYPGRLSFSTSDVLRMGGETGRRWLIARLREQNIGDEAEFSLPDTADALAVLFLRSKGVKFRDAVDAVVGSKEPSGRICLSSTTAVTWVCRSQRSSSTSSSRRAVSNTVSSAMNRSGLRSVMRDKARAQLKRTLNS